MQEIWIQFVQAYLPNSGLININLEMAIRTFAERRCLPNRRLDRLILSALDRQRQLLGIKWQEGLREYNIETRSTTSIVQRDGRYMPCASIHESRGIVYIHDIRLSGLQDERLTDLGIGTNEINRLRSWIFDQTA